MILYLVDKPSELPHTVAGHKTARRFLLSYHYLVNDNLTVVQVIDLIRRSRGEEMRKKRDLKHKGRTNGEEEFERTR